MWEVFVWGYLSGCNCPGARGNCLLHNCAGGICLGVIIITKGIYLWCICLEVIV